MDKQHIEYLTPKMLKSDEPIWVNPVGGLGDIIMLSTAMKRSFNKYGKQFNVARRAQYTEFLTGHPAVAQIGHPPMGCNLVCNDYWMRSEYAEKNTKALQIVLKIFGITDEENDELYLSNTDDGAATKLILENIPWGKHNVVIACSSESPRKMMHPIKWHIIVDKLIRQQCFVMQVGKGGEIPIIGTYSLLGATRPLQLIEILKKADLVITLDNYVMHASKLVNVPAISLFGPTPAWRYGYNGNFNVQADISHCPEADKCLGPHVSDNYSTMCPLAERHCMNQLDEGKIVDMAMTILNKK